MYATCVVDKVPSQNEYENENGGKEWNTETFRAKVCVHKSNNCQFGVARQGDGCYVVGFV